MYFFWYFLMCSQPYIMLFGLFGLLGKDAEKAANDLVLVWGGIVLVAIVLLAIYLGLHSVGLAS